MNRILLKHDSEIKLLQESLNKFENKEKANSIFYNGQMYDAYSKIIDILSSAKKEVIIIDAYADKKTLDIITKIRVKVLLITRNNHLLSKLDIEKYNKQYHNLKITYNNTFHDRYFILDNLIVYHCGTSLNHIGEKTFSITKIEDNEIIATILKNIDKNQ